MTETAIATPTFFFAVGQTDGEFEIATEGGWTDEGLPFSYEYLHLPYEAKIKELNRGRGEAESFAHAIALVRLAVENTPGANIAMFTVSDGTGQTFCATAWEPLADAIVSLDRVAAW